MAKSTLEVVLIEGQDSSHGGSTGAPSPSERANAPQQQSAPRGAPVAKNGQPETVSSSLLESLRKLSQVLGYGGLVTTTTEIVKAFRSATTAANLAAASLGIGGLAKSVIDFIRNARAARADEAVAPKAPSVTVSQVSGWPTAANSGPRKENIVDAEFTDVTPRIGKASSVTSLVRAPARPIGPVAPAGGAMVPAGAAAGGAPAAAAGVGMSAVGAAVALAAVSAAAVITARLLYKLGEAAKSESKRLEQYSPELSLANARTQLREMMSDIRRANRVGPDLARFENARSKLDAVWSDVKTEVMLPIIQLLTIIAEAAVGQVDSAKEGAKAFEKLTEIGREIGQGEFAKSGERFKEMVNLLLGIKDNTAKDEDDFIDPFASQFQSMFEGGNALGLPKGRAKLGPPGV